MIYQHADARRDRELAESMSQLAAALPAKVVTLRNREASA
jgi:hypothetical protein